MNRIGSLLFLFASLPLALTLLGMGRANTPLHWSPPKEIVSGRGIKGHWQQNQSNYDYVDDPTVAFINTNELAIAWAEQNKKDVFFQRFSTDGSKRIGKPLNLSQTPDTFSWLPRVVVAPDATQYIYVVWEEIIFSGGSHGGDILFAYSSDGGQSFTKPLNLSQSIGGDGKGRINEKIWANGSFDLAVGPGGIVVVAWTEYDGPLWIRRSKDGGKIFSQSQQVGGDLKKPARGPTLAVRDKTVYLAWTTGENPSADINIQKSNDGGASFDKPRLAAKTDGYSDAPKLAVDSKAIVHLAYAESRGGPFERSAIHYTQSTDGGRRFKKASVISSPAPESIASARYPDLAVDAQDNVSITWELYPNPLGDPIGLGIAVSTNGGSTFTAPSVIPGSRDPNGGTNGSHQGLLMSKLAVSRTGQLAVVNSSLKRDEYSRVWLMTASLKN